MVDAGSRSGRYREPNTHLSLDLGDECYPCVTWLREMGEDAAARCDLLILLTFRKQR